MADDASAPAPAPAATDRWPALESNAEVMTSFLQRLVQQEDQEGAEAKAGEAEAFSFADVFSLDEECLGFVPQPVHALLLAYESDAIKDKGASGSDPNSGSSGPADAGLVFIRQLPALDAACGTIALLHAAANAPELRKLVVPGSLLGRFLSSSSAAAATTPEAWGERLDGDDALRAAHCASAAAGLTEEVHGEAVVFHFVCFLPTADPSTIVELDGLKPRPVVHAVAGADDEGFLQRAARLIKQEFLSKFEDPEGTQMNVLALTSGAGEEDD